MDFGGRAQAQALKARSCGIRSLLLRHTGPFVPFVRRVVGVWIDVFKYFFFFLHRPHAGIFRSRSFVFTHMSFAPNRFILFLAHRY
jgi:hypothetical protein